MYSLHILILQLNKLKNVVKSICYNPPSAVSTVTENDADADGTPEVITTKKDTNGDGKEDTIIVAEDLDDDGTIDKVTTTSDLGKNGTEVSVETDTDGDGKLDKVKNTFTSLKGNETTEKGNITHSEDGTKEVKYTVQNNEYYAREGVSESNVVDNKFTRTDTIDEHGNVTKEVFDFNRDGKIDMVKMHEYDDKGNIVKTLIDANNDNKYEKSVTREFDDEGNVTKILNDKNNDETPDAITTNEYDDKGRITRVYYDKNADKTNDAFTDYTYDDKDNVVESLQVLDINNTKANYHVKYEYDDLGRRTKITYLDVNTGEEIYITTMEYKDNGNIVKKTFNQASFDTPVKNTTTEPDSVGYDNDSFVKGKEYDTYYDFDGQKVVTSRFDMNKDGEFEAGVDWLTTFTYDDKGNRITRIDDRKMDGSDVSEKVFTYDDFGREVTKIQTNLSNGEITSVSEHNYEYKDSTSFITKETIIEEGKVTQIITHEYNDNYALEKTVWNYDGNETIDAGDWVRLYEGTSWDRPYLDDETADGIYEKLVIKEQNGDFELAGDNKAGLGTIVLGENNTVNLTISDEILTTIANGKTDHKLTIQGSENDTVKISQVLFDTKVEGGDAADTYTGDWGTLTVDPDVTVEVI
ncbi:hypothetical protein [Pasteurella atlantica]|uniref:hypothetical protein n=1 Tax=Pasteurella atlantica TaxID=2827233 RepID=UPI002773C971|nr:hypothetical protein [Pasteurella atlantica]MDP8151464.1 hypothetical protein [Pasteurella atlantica]